ncbi:MAG TPA: phenylacetate--CoA ligase [Chloroflexota bacterium]
MPRTELARLQLDRLRERLAYVYSRVPFYKRRFDDAGVRPEDVCSLGEMARLPFTRKADLRDNYPAGLFAVPLHDCLRIHASSGTRGKPTVVGYNRQDLALWAEVCARTIVACSGQPGDVLQNAYGYGLFTGGFGFHQGAELIGLTVVPTSSGNTARQIMLLQDLQVRGLACTPSYALNIGETMRDAGIAPGSIALRYGIFGAEPCTDELRRQIEVAIPGLTAYDVYGLSEIIGPGVSCECAERSGLHINEDHFLPEIIDPESGRLLPFGQDGELVLTNLTKEALCLIRYRTGDICRLTDEPCPCGRTNVRMSKIKGRSDDMLIVRGVNVFPSAIEAALLGEPEVAPYYQLVVTRQGALDELEVQVEAIAESSDLAPRLVRRLQDVLGLSCRVTLQPAKSIPRSEGKAIRVVDQRPR